MAKAKVLPQVQGIGEFSNTIHLWTKVKGYQYIALCDPDRHTEKVNKSKAGELCSHCEVLGLKNPE